MKKHQSEFYIIRAVIVETLGWMNGRTDTWIVYMTHKRMDSWMDE